MQFAYTVFELWTLLLNSSRTFVGQKYANSRRGIIVGRYPVCERAVCSGTASVKYFIVRPMDTDKDSKGARKKRQQKYFWIFGQENEINYSSLSSIVQKHNTDLELQNGSISKILFHLQITMYENALRRLFLCPHLTSSSVYSQKTRNVSYSFRCPSGVLRNNQFDNENFKI